MVDRDGRFDPLPATATEAAAFADRWRRKTGDDAHRLTGSDATESAVSAALKGRAVVHVATHGFFASEACKSALHGDGFDPMVLSGLVLAGANRPVDPSAAEDGVLTAAEVASLDLSGTGLVVLSACETGLGEVKSGEGVLGLRRAFAISEALRQAQLDRLAESRRRTGEARAWEWAGFISARTTPGPVEPRSW